MQNVWFIWSLIILALWIAIYVAKKGSRKEMLKMSLITMPFGLTEPLFVPEYWFPSSNYSPSLMGCLGQDYINICIGENLYN